MKGQDYTVVEVGVDWLTCSTPDRGVYDLLCETVPIEGRKPFAQFGYTGISAVGARGGCSGDGSSFVQLSGNFAREYWCAFAAIAENVSRLDVQVTARLAYDDEHIARTCCQIVRSHQIDARKKHGPIKMPSPSLISTFGEGDTFYLGKRSSDNYGRIYDKWREQAKSSEYTNCWRYEVEFKNKIAKAATTVLLADIGRFQEHCQNLVHSWFLQRGLECGWSKSSRNIQLPKVSNVTDEDTKLRWLELQVQPSIEFLLRRGYIDAVCSALCIDSRFYETLVEYVQI